MHIDDKLRNKVWPIFKARDVSSLLRWLPQSKQSARPSAQVRHWPVCYIKNLPTRGFRKFTFNENSGCKTVKKFNGFGGVVRFDVCRADGTHGQSESVQPSTRRGDWKNEGRKSIYKCNAPLHWFFQLVTCHAGVAGNRKTSDVGCVATVRDANKNTTHNTHDVAHSFSVEITLGKL
jgi:hypothetical protein